MTSLFNIEAADRVSVIASRVEKLKNNVTTALTLKPDAQDLQAANILLTEVLSAVAQRDPSAKVDYKQRMADNMDEQTQDSTASRNSFGF